MTKCIKCKKECENKHHNVIYCDECRIIERKKGLAKADKKYNKNHPEKRKELTKRNNKKRWASITPEQKQKECKRKRDDYWKDPEKMRKYNRKKYKKWVSSIEGKIKHRLSNYRRRSREKLCGHSFTIKEWSDKLDKTKGVCPGYNCEPHFVGIDKLTLDHTPPISKAPKGYTYKIDDVTPLCMSCNCKKRDNEDK